MLEPLAAAFSTIPSEGIVASRRDLADACEVRLSQAVDALVTSTDLLYEISPSAEEFGYIAVTHGLSDIYAALAQPLFATLTMGVSANASRSGTASSLLMGAAQALRENDAVLAGGHTVLTDDPFVVVSATGVAGEVRATAHPQAGDVVVLSKPLGTGIAIAARRLGLVGREDLETEYASMRRPNRRFGEALAQLLRRDAKSVRGITDVSGFGFLDALRTIGGSSTFELFTRALPRFPTVDTLVAQQAWSGLTDANLLEALNFTDFGSISRDGVVPALLCDPQTSGGLLAVMSNESWQILRESDSRNGLGAVVVGRAGEVADSFRVTLTEGHEASLPNSR